MPRTEPIKSYLRAVEAKRNSQKEKAAELLAEAIGADAPSSIIKDNIDKLLDTGTLPNEAVLQVISTETAKGDKHG